MALTDGLQLLLHANEGLGVTSVDSSGKGNDASLIGTTWNTVDPKLGAAAFSDGGLNDYVEGVSAFGDVDFRSQPHTFARWVWIRESSGQQPLFTFGVATASNFLVNVVYNAAGGRLWYHFHRADNSPAGRTGISVTAGAGLNGGWHFLVVKHNGLTPNLTNMEIKVDDVSIADSTLLGSWGAFQQNKYRIGRNSGNDFAKDFGDEIAAWNRPTTDAEDTFMYNGGLGREIEVAESSRRRRMIIGRLGR